MAERRTSGQAEGAARRQRARAQALDMSRRRRAPHRLEALHTANDVLHAQLKRGRQVLEHDHLMLLDVADEVGQEAFAVAVRLGLVCALVIDGDEVLPLVELLLLLLCLLLALQPLRLLLGPLLLLARLVFLAARRILLLVALPDGLSRLLALPRGGQALGTLGGGPRILVLHLIALSVVA